MPVPVTLELTIDSSQAGRRETELAREIRSTEPQLLREIARKTAGLFKADSIRRNIRRTGAYIRGWDSHKLTERRYEVASFVPHSVYVEAHHRVVTAPHNQNPLKRIVRDTTEKFIDRAMRKVYGRR